MILENELTFLCEVLTRCRARVALLSPGELSDALLSDKLGLLSDAGAPPALSQSTVYRYSDKLGLSYLYFLLPPEGERVFFLGPFLSAPIPEQRFPELLEGSVLSKKRRQRLQEYYAGLPILPDGCQALMMVEIFCERAFAGQSVTFETLGGVGEPLPLDSTATEEGLDGVLVSMKALEQRYRFENELMRAVSQGHIHREPELLSSFSANIFERRAKDPVRDMKNYGIIMNTLLRKAAEEGGVHPLYLDRVSSDFAMRIEMTSELSGGPLLMREMFRTYCRLVRKHTLFGVSPPVQRVALLVDAELSSELSLSGLAVAVGVSPGYLSSLFKREMGKTLSAYIRERRIAHAKHLLAKTQLQVQTVAQECGMMDVQYFSRVFRREEGRTPLEYRAASRAKTS